MTLKKWINPNHKIKRGAIIAATLTLAAPPVAGATRIKHRTPTPPPHTRIK